MTRVVTCRKNILRNPDLALRCARAEEEPFPRGIERPEAQRLLPQIHRLHLSGVDINGGDLRL